MHLRQLKAKKTLNQVSLTLRLQDLHAVKWVTETRLINPEHLLENDDAKEHDLEDKAIPGDQRIVGHERTHRECDGIDQLNIWGDLHDEICWVQKLPDPNQETLRYRRLLYHQYEFQYEGQVPQGHAEGYL